MSELKSAARLTYVRTTSWLAIVAAITLLPSLSFAGPIDLNQLFHDVGAPIDIAADGSTTTLHENPPVGDVFLSDLPGLGDPELLIASAGAQLVFDYDFVEAAGNFDSFNFAILDGLTGIQLDPFTLFFLDSAAGTARFDLSSLVGLTLGFQFDLGPQEGDDGSESTLTISNVRIETPDQTVSEPGMFVLFAIGLLAIVIPRLNKRRPSFS